MAGSPYKLVGRLPGRVAFVSRYKALHRPLDRMVEFRLERGNASPEASRRFFREFDELSRVDHPTFLPLIDRGILRGRQGYVVPFRDHRTLPELVGARALFLPQAVACVRSLGAGLAAAHEAGFFLGPIRPSKVAWDPIAGSAYFLHHRVGAPAYLVRDDLFLPEDVGPEAPPSVAGDVFHWGFFAYFLLTRGTLPYRGAPDAVAPLRSHCPDVVRPLAVAIEAALSADPAARPRDGKDLLAVLQTVGLALAPTRPDPPPTEKVDAMQASAQFQAVVTDLDRMEARGEAWLKGEPEPVDESADEDLAYGAAPDTAEEPDLDQFESTAIPAMAAMPSVPVTSTREGPQAPAPGASEGPAPPLRPTPTPRAPRYAVAVGLGAVLAGVLLAVSSGGRSRPPAVPPPIQEGPGGELAADGSYVPLPPPQARWYQQEPQIRELLLLDTVTPETFPRVVKRLERLIERRKLPPALRDTARLEDLRKLHQSYPQQAAQAMMQLLADLRTVVGKAEDRER